MLIYKVLSVIHVSIKSATEISERVLDRTRTHSEAYLLARVTYIETLSLRCKFQELQLEKKSFVRSALPSSL